MDGAELKRARLNAGLTQKRLGELAGYEGRTAEAIVQHWENNRHPIPLDKFRVLSRILNIPLERFIP